MSELYKPLDISGQTVLITGASSGFGLATAWRFAELKCKLILVARREERLRELAAEISFKFPECSVICEPLDVSEIHTLKYDVDILVNNAGIALGKQPAHLNSTDEIHKMISTNLTSLIIATSTFTKGMIERGRGHLINVSSVSGHEVYAGGSVYCATKHAVTAFTNAARHDFVGTPVRCTSISPGFAETEFSLVRFNDADKAKAVYTDLVPLSANDIADQIVYAATRPAHVQIADIICWPTNQAGPTNIARVGSSLGAPPS